MSENKSARKLWRLLIVIVCVLACITPLTVLIYRVSKLQTALNQFRIDNPKIREWDYKMIGTRPGQIPVTRVFTIDGIIKLRRMLYQNLSFSLVEHEVYNLRALKTMPLERLNLVGCPVSDITPLEGISLKYLYLGGTKVSDINALKGMKLIELDLRDSQVTDYSVLEGMPLERLLIDNNAQNIEFLRSMKTLQVLGSTTVVDFWQKYDAEKTKKKNRY